MSGGVDSSVTAYLLQQQGYHVEGLFMKNWEDDDTSDFCAAEEDKNDAQLVCESLGIKLHTVNFSYEYWENVFEDCLEDFKKGRTPNPDILCNREIKFKEFLAYALQIDADYIATGHYVRAGQDEFGSALLKGLDNNKDQSYFLYAISQQAIQKSLFPIGEYDKSVVRKIAQEQNLITHNKKDSTGLCFIGERKFSEFLNRYIDKSPGDIIDDNGNILGKHNGLMFHTLGQRKGLGIGGAGEPWYVSGKDLTTNQLLVAQGHDHPALMSNVVKITDTHIIQSNFTLEGFSGSAKTRYRQPDQACNVVEYNAQTKTAIVAFSALQWAVTPGQSLVFYHNDKCVGGGIIDSYTTDNTLL